jgi:hypothetical protein
MIVCDFDFISVAVLPDKTNSVLIVDANAVLPRAIAFELFQAIPGRDSKIFERSGAVKHQKLPEGRPAKIGRGNAPAFSRPPEFLRLPVCEAPDHSSYINTDR